MYQSETLKNQPIACTTKADFVTIKTDKHTNETLCFDGED
jgi:hypothetical protein